MSKKARVHVDESHWLLLTLSDGRQVRCYEPSVVVGHELELQLCERHVVLSRESEDHAVATLHCATGGARVDGIDLKRDKQLKIIGGKMRLRCGHKGARHVVVNASVLLGLPRSDIEWLEVIGVGSQAEVKKVRLLSTGELLAAKIFHKGAVMATRQTVAEALAEDGRKEAEMLLTLRHPHIVSLHQIIESERHLILLLGLVNSGDLADIINHNLLPRMQVRSVFRQMAEAVAFLHRHRVAHVDLKPSNFLVNREADGTLKLLLTDFATAAFFGRTHVLHRVAWTPLYCAPELISLPEAFTNAVDVWSLGVCLYIIQTDGIMPFETTEEILAGTYNADLIEDAVARDLCKKMLVVEVRERYDMDQVMSHPYLCILDERLREHGTGHTPHTH